MDKVGMKGKTQFLSTNSGLRPISILLVTINMCGQNSIFKNGRNEECRNFLMLPSPEQTQLLLALSTLRTHTARWRRLGKYIWPASGSLGKYLANRLPTFALSKYSCDTEPTSLFIQRTFEISFSSVKFEADFVANLFAGRSSRALCRIPVRNLERLFRNLTDD